MRGDSRAVMLHASGWLLFKNMTSALALEIMRDLFFAVFKLPIRILAKFPIFACGFNMLNVLLVAFGGAVGSVCRYLTGVFMTRLYGPMFPWGTLTVNVLGSFAIGFLTELVARRLNASMEMRLLIVTGFLVATPPSRPLARYCGADGAGSERGCGLLCRRQPHRVAGGYVRRSCSCRAVL